MWNFLKVDHPVVHAPEEEKKAGPPVHALERALRGGRVHSRTRLKLMRIARALSQSHFNNNFQKSDYLHLASSSA
jgi:hypothetical protein